MSLFNGKRLTNDTFKLDVERMREGWYSDKYFINAAQTLQELSRKDYTFNGNSPILEGKNIDVSKIECGDIEVEMQIFTRREPFALIAGVDKALSILKHCTGYKDENGDFVETWQNLEVEAVQDGVKTEYGGDPMDLNPVMKIRGRYRDFAILETPVLGAITRGSRIATNVYNTLVAAKGKPIMFFPARFDAHELQAADGYAYDIAVERFNMDYSRKVDALVSTDAQGDWWASYGGGTVAHAAIASFLGDITETMITFAETQPPDVPRIALVDFLNDSVGDTLKVLEEYFKRYKKALENDREEEAKRWTLYGVRLDTSSHVRDINIPPLGDRDLDTGVNPRLVWVVRNAIDEAYKDWDLNEKWNEKAREYCENVKIVASGGFDPEKITKFEELNVPVDAYGVGSSLMSNEKSVGTNTDFTADVVRVKIDGKWVDMAKVGRKACDNEDLEIIDLEKL